MQETESKRNTWNIMSSAFNHNFTPTGEEISNISSFVFCRLISNHIFGSLITNFISVYPEIPIEAQYKLIRNSMPKIKYLKYPSSQKAEKTEIIENICDLYNCNIQTAIEYCALMTDAEKERISEKYKYQKIEKRKR